MSELLTRYTGRVDERLKELLRHPGIHPVLRDAMYYSIEAGGKRFRPTLNIMANALLGGEIEETLTIACAIEMLHTCSLIHDDLPAMDNDELRRGKPTNHVVFGEANAILAGDGLMNYAYEVMMDAAMRYPDKLGRHLRAMREVAYGAGVCGMITGQSADIENEGQMLTETELEYVHRHKTGDMIKSALVSGLLLCGPSEAQLDAMTLYGYNVGLTFQIIDDILDITSDAATLGKSVGKDKKAKKFTYPTLYGLEKSREIAGQKTEQAIEALGIFGADADELRELARVVLNRDK